MSIDWPSLTILVVDDQPFIHQLLTPMLRSMGPATVLRAMDADAALELLPGKKIDLALIDYLMMPLDGIRLIERIRKDEDSPAPTLPIIMITGDATQDTLSAGLAAGINDFICKPFAAKTILAHIELMLADPVPFVRTPSYFGPDRAEQMRRQKARQPLKAAGA